jgi:hypothetical protein
MAGAIPDWARLAHDSWKNSAVGILTGIRWTASSNNAWGAHYRYIFNLLRVGPRSAPAHCHLPITAYNEVGQLIGGRIHQVAYAFCITLYTLPHLPGCARDLLLQHTPNHSGL